MEGSGEILKLDYHHEDCKVIAMPAGDYTIEFECPFGYEWKRDLEKELDAFKEKYMITNVSYRIGG